MADDLIPDVVCDVEVPRDDENTYVPQSWLEDLSPNFSAVGMAVFLLSYERGEVIPGTELVDRHHSSDRPLGEILGELVEAGYLVPEGDGKPSRCRLVHPARLEPLPAI